MSPRIPTTTRPIEAGVPEPILDEAPARVRDRAGPLRPGDRIGRYVIGKQLGSGGMGVVYGARDTALGRRVALKLVRRSRRAGPHDDQFSQRLCREAQALARLSHPNVLGLYDLGTADDVLFLAMEFIDGDDLSRWTATCEPDWHATMAVYEQAGRGLAAAHAAGIVHRDFKPTNAIVGPDGHVTVVDFGLARGTELLGAPAPDDSNVGDLLLSKTLTDVNVIIGTRGYMAPEQLLGLPVGPASDQFSFCVSLFEALYRARPYPGRNAIETARAFAAQALMEPEDRRDVPEHVHRALLRGLSIEPTLRFPSMDALLGALSPPVVSRRRLGLAALVFATAAASAVATAWVGALWDGEPAVATAAVTCTDAARP